MPRLTLALAIPALLAAPSAAFAEPQLNQFRQIAQSLKETIRQKSIEWDKLQDDLRKTLAEKGKLQNRMAEARRTREMFHYHQMNVKGIGNQDRLLVPAQYTLPQNLTDPPGMPNRYFEFKSTREKQNFLAELMTLNGERKIDLSFTEDSLRKTYQLQEEHFHRSMSQLLQQAEATEKMRIAQESRINQLARELHQLGGSLGNALERHADFAYDPRSDEIKGKIQNSEALAAQIAEIDTRIGLRDSEREMIIGMQPGMERPESKTALSQQQRRISNERARLVRERNAKLLELKSVNDELRLIKDGQGRHYSVIDPPAPPKEPHRYEWVGHEASKPELLRRPTTMAHASAPASGPAENASEGACGWGGRAISALRRLATSQAQGHAPLVIP